MENLESLFTVASLLSLQGSTAASLLVPNVLSYLIGDAFRPYKKWASFGIALALSYLVALLAEGTGWTKWVLALFNGFLVFASAVGINEAAGSNAARPSDMMAGGALASAASERRFFETWF